MGYRVKQFNNIESKEFTRADMIILSPIITKLDYLTLVIDVRCNYKPLINGKSCE